MRLSGESHRLIRPWAASPVSRSCRKGRQAAKWPPAFCRLLHHGFAAEALAVDLPANAVASTPSAEIRVCPEDANGTTRQIHDDTPPCCFSRVDRRPIWRACRARICGGTDDGGGACGSRFERGEPAFEVLPSDPDGPVGQLDATGSAAARPPVVEGRAGYAELVADLRNRQVRSCSHGRLP